jgi:hypothetical protein
MEIVLVLANFLSSGSSARQALMLELVFLAWQFDAITGLHFIFHK